MLSLRSRGFLGRSDGLPSKRNRWYGLNSDGRLLLNRKHRLYGLNGRVLGGSGRLLSRCARTLSARNRRYGLNSRGVGLLGGMSRLSAPAGVRAWRWPILRSRTFH